MKNNWCIEPKDLDMCKWACNYLYRRFGVALPKFTNESEYEYCQRVINSQQEGNDRDNLIKTMQTAWRQKKHKEKQIRKGKVPCSFILSAATLRNLNRLSASFGETINETLERVINGTYLIDKENKKQQMAAKKEQKNAIQRPDVSEHLKPIYENLRKMAEYAAKGDPEEPEHTKSLYENLRKMAEYAAKCGPDD